MGCGVPALTGGRRSVGFRSCDTECPALWPALVSLRTVPGTGRTSDKLCLLRYGGVRSVPLVSGAAGTVCQTPEAATGGRPCLSDAAGWCRVPGDASRAGSIHRVCRVECFTELQRLTRH